MMRGGTSYVARYLHYPATSSMGMGDSLFAVAVDPERFDPVGAPVPVIQGIHNHLARFCPSPYRIPVPSPTCPLKRGRRGRTRLVGPRRERHNRSRGTWRTSFSVSALAKRARAVGVTLERGRAIQRVDS